MRRSLATAFSSGASRSVLIGSDIPGITADILATAFDRLKSVDIVLGPASDGGYYLIGFRRSAWRRGAEALFTAMPWGSSRLLAATRKKIGALSYQVHMLETLADIDRPQDLAVWEQRLR